MLQVDPSQKKLVAGLMVALVAAVGVLVVRVMPTQQPTQAIAQAEQQSAAASASVECAERVCLTRNPFERPRQGCPTVQTLVPLARESHPDTFTSPHLQRKLPPLPQPYQVLPMPVQAAARAGKPSDSTPSASVQETKPSFKLLATVRGPGGYSAVLDDGKSGPRVVEIGDVVDGNFKVADIQDGIAVLTDGRYVVIAKRPRS